jgi:sugar/nucleoside kinase (ribokinase family)
MSVKFDVIVVGELNVDLILNRIDGFPEVGKEILAKDMTLTLGSSSAIFASNLSSLGARVAFLGMIGTDQFGDLVLESLKRKKVGTEYIIRRKDLNTGATIVLNFDQDRAMVTHTGAMEHLTLADIAGDVFKQARHLHFSSFFLQPGIRPDVGEMLKRAKSNGLTTSLDIQWDPEEKWDFDYRAILPHVDVFLPNETELQMLTGKTGVDDALKTLSGYAHIIAVKMGDRGSLVMQDGKKNTIPAFLNKNVVDAIGAGDSFNAGFIYQLVNKKPITECQRFANLTGAVSTTAAGGTTAFSDLQRVLEIGRSKFGYDG